MQLMEIIETINSHYSSDEQREILKILWRVNCTIPDSPYLESLINIGILEQAENKFLSYKLRKFFEKYSYDKISQKKNSYFQNYPIQKG